MPSACIIRRPTFLVAPFDRFRPNGLFRVRGEHVEPLTLCKIGVLRLHQTGRPPPGLRPSINRALQEGTAPPSCLNEAGMILMTMVEHPRSSGYNKKRPIVGIIKGQEL